jgi:hypothetical protein
MIEQDERFQQSEFRSLLLLNDVPHAVATGRDEPIEWLKRWGAVR